MALKCSKTFLCVRLFLVNTAACLSCADLWLRYIIHPPMSCWFLCPETQRHQTRRGTEDWSCFPFISIVDMDLKIMEDCVVYSRRLTHSLILEIFEPSVWTDRSCCGVAVACGRLAGLGARLCGSRARYDAESAPRSTFCRTHGMQNNNFHPTKSFGCSWHPSIHQLTCFIFWAVEAEVGGENMHMPHRDTLYDSNLQQCYSPGRPRQLSYSLEMLSAYQTLLHCKCNNAQTLRFHMRLCTATSCINR